MAVQELAASVTNVATPLTPANLVDAIEVAITNDSAVTLRVGGSTVAAATGLAWPAGKVLEATVRPGERLYAIAAAPGPYAVTGLAVGV